MTAIITTYGVVLSVGDPASEDILLSGSTMDPESYDERRARQWADLSATADAGFPGGIPPIPPLATPAPCKGGCGVQVALAPNQQVILEAESEASAICYLCLLEVVGSPRT